MDLIDRLSTYLPHTLAARIRREPGRPLFNQGERIAAVTLFADMAGFTPLAEALGALGSAGTEELTRVLNSRFTPLIEEIERWGGVVGKFAGKETKP
jgi:class 3 adenylate cyclase